MVYHKKKRKLLRIILITICAIIAAGIIYLCISFYPDYKIAKNEAYQVLSTTDESSFVRAGNTVIYSDDGSVIAKVGNEKYTYVSITDISSYITNGYIAREDKNFATHNGVDVKALARAGLSYIKNRGEITQGGSTITQQLVKNCMLSQEQTFSRKLTEILLALQIERQYSKRQIMEYYCNYNYYGNGCYGVEGASQYYFGKSASQLTLSEAAMLVATSNAPSVCNPVADYDLTVSKKNAVLDDMYECGYITEDELNSAKAENPEIVRKTENTVNYPYLSSYALYCTTLKLMELNGFEFQYLFSSEEEETAYDEAYSAAYQEATEQVYTGGYEIYTSLNITMQEKLQDSINENLADYTEKSEDGIYKMQSAAVCIDNETQMVTAIVGGREGEGEYNRGYQAKRQPGSSIKPLLDYGPLLNEGDAYAGTMFTDKETTVDSYTPQNSSESYQGDMTVREALIRSINTIALQAFDKTGAETALSYLENMEFSTISYTDIYAPAIAIGGFTNGVTVEDMTRGFATLANNGEYSENDCIYQITDYMGEDIFTVKDDNTQVFLEDTAFILTDIMHGSFVEDYGLAHGVETNGQYYAGKTGTTNNNFDAWFCGYSAYYTTSVWVGYDYPEDIGFYGGDAPLDIWIDFMNQIHDGLEEKEFAVPDTVRLRKIGSDETMDVTYDKDIYESRPKDYDYYSTVTELRIKEKEALEAEKELEKQAQDALEEFEAYQITDTDYEFNSLYNKAFNLITRLTDDEIRTDFLDRLETKRQSLTDEVNSKWDPLSEDEAEQARLSANLQSEKDAQTAYDTAENDLQTSRINLAREYINALNECTVYTDHVETLITYGLQALDKCKSYSEYNSLTEQYNSAVDRARALKTPSTDTDNVPQPSEAETAETTTEPAEEEETTNTTTNVDTSLPYVPD